MSRVAKERESLEKAQAQAVGYVHRLGKRVARAEKREDSRATRRKIVAGAAVLTMTRKNTRLRHEFAAFLQTFVTRPADRLALELDEPEPFLERDARQTAAAEAEKARAEATQTGEEINAALSSLDAALSKPAEGGSGKPADAAAKDSRARAPSAAAANGAAARSPLPPPPNGSAPSAPTS